MPATIEQSTVEQAPVFVSDGRGRNHAVRVAAAALGLLLAGWLAALGAGLIGFSALPELALPGAGATRSAPAPPDQAPADQGATGRDTKARGSSTASRVAPRARAGSSAKASAATVAAGGGAAQNGSGTGGSGASSSSSNSGGASAQPQPTTPPTDTTAHGGSGHQPSFTPPVSGEKSADPPQGNSADAPGRTVSADPPGTATRPHSA